jgi:hypothetical protein
MEYTIAISSRSHPTVNRYACLIHVGRNKLASLTGFLHDPTLFMHCDPASEIVTQSPPVTNRENEHTD